MRGIDPRLGLRMEIGSRPNLGEEHSPWFWNPGLFGIRLGPEWFRDRLHEIDPDLEVSWSPVEQRWLVWVKDHRIQTQYCRNWRLLFKVQDNQGQFVPLDERTFAKIYLISGRSYRNASEYFDSVVREDQRVKERLEKADHDEVTYKAGEYFDYTKPKVGFGSISASKVVGQ